MHIEIYIHDITCESYSLQSLCAIVNQLSIVPQDRISWEGHLFGLVVGFAAAMALVKRPPPKPVDDGPMYPWELDEPWKVDEA